MGRKWRASRVGSCSSSCTGGIGSGQWGAFQSSPKNVHKIQRQLRRRSATQNYDQKSWYQPFLLNHGKMVTRSISTSRRTKISKQSLTSWNGSAWALAVTCSEWTGFWTLKSPLFWSNWTSPLFDGALDACMLFKEARWACCGRSFWYCEYLDWCLLGAWMGCCWYEVETRKRKSKQTYRGIFYHFTLFCFAHSKQTPGLSSSKRCLVSRPRQTDRWMQCFVSYPKTNELRSL